MESDVNNTSDTESQESAPCILPGSSSNPTLTGELNPEDIEKIRGDAIGNTMYSQRFVLQTLIDLLNVKWNEEFESTLCTLWDMTTEKDVVNFLFDHDFIALAVSVIGKSEEPRLTEIIVGIIGNMCCIRAVADKLKAFDDFEAFTSLLYIQDTPILIQVIRFFKTLIQNTEGDFGAILNEDVLTQINFILLNSRNSELLQHTLDLFICLTDKDKLESIFLPEILSGLNEAYKQLFTDNLDEVDFAPSEFYQKLNRNYTQCLSFIAEVIDKRPDVFSDIQEYIGGTTKCLTMLLSQYSKRDILMMEIDEVEYYLTCLPPFFSACKMNFNSEILYHLMLIYEELCKGNYSFDDDFEECLNFCVSYFIHVGTEEQLRAFHKDNFVECSFALVIHKLKKCTYADKVKPKLVYLVK